MNRPLPPAAPLSRRFDVAAVRDGGVDAAVDSTDAERAALAHDCAIPAIDALRGDYRVRREGRQGLRVLGRVTARVRQVCVVSLDEFATDIDEPVDVAFAPEAEVEALAEARAARPAEAEDAEDLPDPIRNGRIDLGALTAEMLVLALDPHPRRPGIAFAPPAADASEAGGASPFAALRGLVDRS